MEGCPWTRYGTRSRPALARRPEKSQMLLGLRGAGKTVLSLLGPLGHVLAMKLGAWRSRREASFFIAQINQPDLDHLRRRCEAGEVRRVVERSYPLRDVADALQYVGDGHPRGKVVITV